jgi:hypothetical protein
MHPYWIPRDSTNIWQHEGPDTGLIRIQVTPWRSIDGHLISHDSQWVTIVTDYGEKQEYLASHVRMVYDRVMKRDTGHSFSMRGGNLPSQPNRMKRFESYFAPITQIGTTFPSENATGVFAWNLGAFYAFRIPHVAYEYLGGFISASVDSKTFEYTEPYAGTDYFSIRYLSATAGVSYRGFVSAGFTISVPYPGGSLRTFYSSSRSASELYFAQRYTIATNLIRTNFEPRIALGLPLWYSNQSQQALMLVAECGYPLGPALWDNLPESEFPKLSNIRLPEVTIGFSYVVPLSDQYPFPRMLVD